MAAIVALWYVLRPTMIAQPTLRLHKSLSALEYFTFGFGSMVGVGWLVLMDDWLGRGGPGGAMLGFLLGGLLLLPVAQTYGRLVRRIQDAGAEIAYTDGVFRPFAGFAAGWAMVLAYAIVCPWEAVAIGNILARMVPTLNSYPMYTVAGTPIYAPRVLLGLALTGIIAWVNHRGIRQSGLFQDVTTFGLLAVFAIFAALGFARGDAGHLQPLFARPGAAGAWLSTLLVLQIVPYFMTGFESVAKGSEEARAGFDPRGFSRAIHLSVVAGAAFYVVVVAVVAFVYPWQELVSGRVRTETAFARAFGSETIARLILVGALLSLFKVFNGNFVAATRLLYAIGRRGLVHPSLARVHPAFGTPTGAIALMAALTAVTSLLGDTVLVPITEVGSLASGIGWLSAMLAFLARGGGASGPGAGRAAAAIGAGVSLAIVAMKVVPAVPGSFGTIEWIAFCSWLGLGLAFWVGRRRLAVEAPGRRG